MYVVTILTPSNDNPDKKVVTYYVGQVVDNGVKYTDWDEDIKWAKVFYRKLDAKRVVSYLRTLKGSEEARVYLRERFSKN